MGWEVLQREDDRASRSGQPSPDGSLEAREREDSVDLLSPSSSQQGALFGLTQYDSVFRSRSGSGTGGTISRHNSHVSHSNVSLTQSRRARIVLSTVSAAHLKLVFGRVG